MTFASRSICTTASINSLSTTTDPESRRRIGTGRSSRSCSWTRPAARKPDSAWGWRSSSAPLNGTAAKWSFHSRRWAARESPPRGPRYRRNQRCSPAFTAAKIQALALVLRLPLLDGGHGVPHMLFGIHRRVLVNDLAGGCDHIGSTIGVLGLGGEHGVIGLGDALVGIGCHRKLIAAFAHGELVERIDGIVRHPDDGGAQGLEFVRGLG